MTQNDPTGEIVNTRTLNAPRELVFQAFADPKHLAQWWGPNGFTNTIHEFDLKPGGAFRLTMHGPNGANYANEKRFLIVEPERIVFEHLEPMHHFKMTMLFTGQGSRTQITWRMLFESVAEGARLKDFIFNANEQNLDRLERHLATMTNP